MPEETPRQDPGRPRDLAEVLTDLGAQIDRVREDVTASADRRTRVLSYLLAVVAFIAVLAIGAAVYAHLRVGGAVDDVQTQQERQDRALAASCTAFARLGDPRLLSPTSGPVVRAIVTDFGAAADIIGCPKPPPLPLTSPTAPGPSPAPRPSG